MAELEAELRELGATEKTRAGHLQHLTGSLQKQRDELSQGEEERRELEKKISESERAGRRIVFCYRQELNLYKMDTDACWANVGIHR